MTPPCPVCTSANPRHLLTVAGRVYWRCRHCRASFLDPAQRPTRREERAEYDRHQNSVDDPGYRRFLQPAAEAVGQRVRVGATVLDYGCGPGPALGMMLRERGYRVRLYDPLYRPDPSFLDQRFEAITCTETAEHFHDPAAEFERLHDLLKPSGWLVVMTRFQTNDNRFADWHYRRDPTHVVFYRPQTFTVLGQRFGWRVATRRPNLVLIQRPPVPISASRHGGPAL